MSKRTKSIKKYEEHSFYCLNCGKKGIPIWRDRGHLHSKNHRKALYCPNCKTTVNHIEINNLEDAVKFKEDFEKGLYKEEAAESISCIQKQLKEIL